MGSCACFDHVPMLSMVGASGVQLIPVRYRGYGKPLRGGYHSAMVTGTGKRRRRRWVHAETETQMRLEWRRMWHGEAESVHGPGVADRAAADRFRAAVIADGGRVATECGYLIGLRCEAVR